ncbi:hypothetical protein [Legionella jordanis]|uniref:Effector protein B, substrate of the Dot/Icm secretion system n=1 Tax=Legionella jordanis TaxID=456 RepID=A0A0W0V9J5_9GAMM|nr:hypothetical protein [Legionella jordanis]KTD16801.1 hypothetical protein Ljor_1107 [Legionella jordanis]RMX03674.1 hypothetical protein EAW55_04715 [Legionella jordanis]RMX22265.1 hypothetical protein EAS68_01715 [Legionella jordanis]VEH11732.1 substrate of the Dot/Icm secretion system, LepB-like [Legionella jordanis]
MPSYKGKELTKYKEKTGGKNRNAVDGFYNTSDGEEFFIKKPDDLRELFAELFAGQLLEEFKSRGLIPQIYQQSFICTDFIQFEDGSYGLIQPKVLFTELHKIIGTSRYDASDRSPLWEMILGPNYYLLLTNLEHYFGLSMVLMFSLLIADYSVHSGNVICLELKNHLIQFGRIDFGAAFRNFGYQKNNENVLYPLEYQGLFNFTAYTKGYLGNYKKITGLFSAIAGKAQMLAAEIDEPLLCEMVTAVLSRMPGDLIDEITKKSLTSYLGIPSFMDLSLGNVTQKEPFCHDFAKILTLRLKKIIELKNLGHEKNKPSLYRSVSLENLGKRRSPLKVQFDLSFPDQLEFWQEILTKQNANLFREIEMEELVAQFHSFRDELISQAESIHSLKPSGTSSIPASEEGKFLQQAFNLYPDGSPVSQDSTLMTEHKKPHSLVWQEAEHTLSAAFNLLVIIRVSKETLAKQILEEAQQEAVNYLLKTVIDQIIDFKECYQRLLNQFEAAVVDSSCNNVKGKRESADLSHLDDKKNLTDEKNEQPEEFNEDFNGLEELNLLMQEKMAQDVIFRQILSSGEKECFSPILIRDLLAIKKFYDLKIAFLAAYDVDDGTQLALNAFYEEALIIRLSKMPWKKQAYLIIKIAYKEFGQVQPDPLLLVEALNMISGLFGGFTLPALGQTATHSHLFFEQNLSKRKKMESGQLLTKECLLEGQPTERILTGQASSVKY